MSTNQPVQRPAPATTLAAPHATIPTTSQRERFALELFDDLWQRYRSRVSYVRDYEQLVVDQGASFVNDHIAFRTIACQKPHTGIATIARVFQALGYIPAGCYTFPDKHLSSIHFQHPNARFPKIFISELKSWEFGTDTRKVLNRILKSHRPNLADKVLFQLTRLDQQSNEVRGELLGELTRFFGRLPWEPPSMREVETVNSYSQFAAWVLVHGYDVNHFTALVNSHGVASLDDIDKTVAAMRAAGIPMKAEIEGAPGSKLRQSATEAVITDVRVFDGRATTRMPWTYAYFEIAERGTVIDPGTNEPTRFEGFLGPQASQLFDMTRRTSDRK